MPRRHPRGRDRPRPVEPRLLGGIAPGWAQIEGFSVRSVRGDKGYRCPGCQQGVRPGAAHLVVVPDEDPRDRRHWHTACWRGELRLRGR